jgi:hypothetical protein
MPPHLPVPDRDEVIAATCAWIERAVIGLNLCPFAKAVYVKRQIRYEVSKAVTVAVLQTDLERELQTLVQADPLVTDTTLLIHPRVLTDFLDYNDFLDVADETLNRLGLVGVIQIASFHPAYQFADATPDDVANHTNRSPYPMLHLLREASVERGIASIADAAGIHQRNIETVRRLGPTGLAALGLAQNVDRTPPAKIRRRLKR